MLGKGGLIVEVLCACAREKSRSDHTHTHKLLYAVARLRTDTLINGERQEAADISIATMRKHSRIGLTRRIHSPFVHPDARELPVLWIGIFPKMKHQWFMQLKFRGKLGQYYMNNLLTSGSNKQR